MLASFRLLWESLGGFLTIDPPDCDLPQHLGEYTPETHLQPNIYQLNQLYPTNNHQLHHLYLNDLSTMSHMYPLCLVVKSHRNSWTHGAFKVFSSSSIQRGEWPGHQRFVEISILYRYYMEMIHNGYIYIYIYDIINQIWYIITWHISITLYDTITLYDIIITQLFI